MDCGQVRSYKIDQTMSIWYTGSENRNLLQSEKRGRCGMKLSSFIYFAKFGIKTILLQKKDPILGTIILTDKCNLKCKHCSVNNIQSVIYPYEQIRKEMKQLYQMGVRILFFCGGETFLWQDSGKRYVSARSAAGRSDFAES